MTKRRIFITLAILILLGSTVGVVYFQQNYEIIRKTPEITKSEVEETPKVKPKLTSAEIADYRYRQAIKSVWETYSGNPEALEKYLDSPGYKAVMAKVKSPEEYTAELSALSDEEWKIQRKEFDEKLKRVLEEIEKDKLNPALSPLEFMQKMEQEIKENQEWNESIQRRVQLYFKMKQEDPEDFEDDPDVSSYTERIPDTPVNTISDPNKSPDNTPWNDVVTAWDDTLIEDYRDLFTDRDKEAREAFSQRLPSDDARKYYESRQVELHNQYATRILAQLTKIPPEKRPEAIVGIRQELSRTWDEDFIDSVMLQLQQKK